MSPQAIAGNLIARPRLLAAFSGYDRRKATYLLAPAGYGKTVLMDQFRMRRPSKKRLLHYSEQPS